MSEQGATYVRHSRPDVAGSVWVRVQSHERSEPRRWPWVLLAVVIVALLSAGVVWAAMSIGEAAAQDFGPAFPPGTFVSTIPTPGPSGGVG